MTQLFGTSETWAILLPADTVWIDRGKQQPTETSVEHPRSTHTAVIGSRRTLRRRSGKDAAGCRTYIAFPSYEHPLLVTNQDSAILRYLTDSVLSTPPGIGRVPTFLLTIGRRLLRRQSAWMLATWFSTAGVVSVQEQ